MFNVDLRNPAVWGPSFGSGIDYGLVGQAISRNPADLRNLVDLKNPVDLRPSFDQGIDYGLG